MSQLYSSAIFQLGRHFHPNYLKIPQNVTKLSFYVTNVVDFDIWRAELCVEI